jgi:tetratricopeptide (TPR) repeat protein
MMDKNEKRAGKKERIIAYITINRAAGHILLGDMKTAKVYLEEIDNSFLSEKNGTYLVYTLNLITCLYELGEIEKAEMLYENNMVRLSPIGKRLQTSVDILIGERYYYLEKYDMCYERLKNMLNHDLSKKQYLGILYRLAKIDLINGETDLAIKRFKKIAKLGNKLGIVKESREIISDLGV